MAKISLEDMLDALNQLRGQPLTPEAIAALRKALASTSNHVVTKASQVVRELQIDALHAELADAFDRFMKEPGKDKGCRTKAEIAETLYQLGAPSDAVFTRGIRHVQWEYAFGAPNSREDTAVNLRGSCAMGLVRMGHPDSMIELADLLADPEAPARIMAARAIGYSESPDGLPLLRYKATIGDQDAQVVGECCASLIKINACTSLVFVERLLKAAEPESEAAEQIAIALGASRLQAALPVLIAWHERTLDAAARKVALVSIAMLRCDAAIDFLLTQVREASHTGAVAAIEGLAIYRHDASIRARVTAAVTKRGDRKLKAAMDEAMGE